MPLPGLWLRNVLGWLLVVAVLVLGAGPALAEPPSRLAEQVTDTVGALSDQRAEVDRALAALQAEQQIQLWVAYVATFDGMSGQDWVDRTAELSGLGGNDMLFAVATQDRAYGYSTAEEMPVTEDELEDIMAGAVEPELVARDWAGATIALADALADPSASGAGSGSGSGTGVLWGVLAGVALLGAGVAAVVFLISRRSRRPASGPDAGGGGPGGTGAAAVEVTIDDLRKDAAAALIEADDSIRTSEQELGFAIAQFGEQSAAPFTAALAASREELGRAFHLQRELVGQADGGPKERDVLEQIVALSRSADARLDDQVEQFDELRDLERTIDTVLPDLAARTTAMEGRLSASRATAEALTAQWPRAALATLTANLEQAVERIRFAAESVTVGTELLRDGDRNGAVARARAAEESLGQATTMLDSVDRAPEILALARDAISALMIETEKDVAEAERLGITPELAGVHRYASQTLAWARTVLASGDYDPIAARRALEESDSALEAALAPAREAAASRQRAQALLATSTEAARVSIQVADDYITTRRGAVGAEARTRLAEAQRHFAAGQAAAATDPTTALQHMQAADHLSDQAHALAQQDESRYRNSQQMGGGGMGNLGSIVLGGILIDAMSGGRGRGGGGGGFGLPGGGGFGGGSRGPGSFGGGGTRGRRSGGGRF